VQLLLTFEPSIVERAASLLTRLVEDNPTLPRLYLSGAFFFALMYTGSNVLPLIRFLHVAHLQQLYQDEESGSASGLAARSYLTLILPQAMVCCLEVHGPDKFAKDDEAMIASDDI
jgi:DnaJ homolog subfamily C member 13